MRPKRTTAGLMLMLALLACVTAPSHTLACQVPVFRYALEKWIPDPFEVTIIHKGKLSADQAALIDRIRNASRTKTPTNLTIGKVIDSDNLGDEDKAYVQNHQPKSYPWMVIDFPDWVRTDRAAFSGPFDSGNVENVFDSPARKEIIKRLIAGESAVWILIESGDKTKDDQAAKILTDTFKIAHENLKLPIEEIKADKDFEADTVVKLQIAFSVLRVKQNDPAETFFVSHLINSEPDLFKFTKEPIAIPVFGRGRSYFALASKGLNARNLSDDAKFLTSACSCTVKRENPGSDLVFTANWNGLIKGSALPPETAPTIAGLALPDRNDVTVAAASSPSGSTDTLPGPTAQQIQDQQRARRRSDAVDIAQLTPTDKTSDDSGTTSLATENTARPVSMILTLGLTLGGLLVVIVLGSIMVRSNQNKA